MTIIPVTYEIELPDEVDAVGGVLVFEWAGRAIVNIEHTDGSWSAWMGSCYAWKDRWATCRENETWNGYIVDGGKWIRK